jgi:hypothetical protein
MYAILTIIEAPDDASATRVAAERLGHDEDYGFPYTISHVKLFRAENWTQSKMGGKLILALEDGRTVCEPLIEPMP